MKIKNFIYILVFVLAFYLSACSDNNHSVLLIGKIKAPDNFELQDSFLQLVPIIESDGFRVEYIYQNYDQNVKFLGYRYASNHPRLSLANNIKFSYSIESIMPGRYVLTINDLIPKYELETAIEETKPKYVSMILSDNTGNYIILNIEKELLPPTKIFLPECTIQLTNKATKIETLVGKYIFIK
jgi:hypothetical protein